MKARKIVDFARLEGSEKIVGADPRCWRDHPCMDHLEKVCIRSARSRSPTTPAVMIAEEPFSSDGLHLFGKLYAEVSIAACHGSQR